LTSARLLREKATIIFAALAWTGATAAQAGLVSNFADIEFWAGSGANQAAFVIDWQDGRVPLAWGYRWEGTATGGDMLRAVVEADPQLYAKVGPDGSLGTPMYGLGYDRDDDGFGISDQTVFPPSGLFVSTTIPDQFGAAAVSIDAGDSYREGWLTGFWSYWNRRGEPYSSSWSLASGGFAGRTLTDGDWDGWSFDATFGLDLAPQQPQAATSTPEPSSWVLTLVALTACLLWPWAARRQR